MPQFMHHEDEELLGRHYGGPEEIPVIVRQAYAQCARFWHGAIGGSGPLPGGSLITLVAMEALGSTVGVNMPVAESPKLLTSNTTTLHEDEPPVGDKHSPILDLKVDTPVRVNGKLGYYVKPWGQDKCCVRIEGDDKPYRQVSLTEVELAV